MSGHLPESFFLASILAEQGLHHQEGLWVRWLAKDNSETNPITIKPEAVSPSQVAELFSWVPLPHCSPPGCPFPIKSLALSAHVSPWTIHFWVLDKSPVSGPGRGPPTLCNPMDCSLPDSTVHRILQARILEWVAMPPSRGSSQPRDQICVSYVSCIALAGRFFTTRDTRKAIDKNYIHV